MANVATTSSTAIEEITGNNSSSLSERSTPALALARAQLREKRSNMVGRPGVDVGDRTACESRCAATFRSFYAPAQAGAHPMFATENRFRVFLHTRRPGAGRGPSVAATENRFRVDVAV